jgi:hypothetical protein
MTIIGIMENRWSLYNVGRLSTAGNMEAVPNKQANPENKFMYTLLAKGEVVPELKTSNELLIKFAIFSPCSKYTCFNLLSQGVICNLNKWR